MRKYVTASIVLYNHTAHDVVSLFEELAKDLALAEWMVVDNGGSETACVLAESLGARCLRSDRNLGYGAGHNLALRSLVVTSAPYHAILNPDIQLQAGDLSQLVAVMNEVPQAGLLMPRVLYPDGSTQYLCKLLPTPLDLILRRFAGGHLQRIFASRMAAYDMKNLDYSRPAYVPVLSGCFMFARRSVLESIGGFDERFFLYMEDTDLCRRIGDVSQLLFWPGVTVVHGHAQGSYKNFHMLRLHVKAAIAYFNKWGWWYDPDRNVRNTAGFTNADIDFVRSKENDDVE